VCLRHVYPVIKIDDEHNHIKPGADRNVIYKVSSGKGIIVDATGFDFTLLKKYLDGKLPDKIFIVSDKGTFVANFNATGKTTLDKYSLHPFADNSTFTRFQSGDAPVIAIGTVQQVGKKSKIAQVWATTIHVR
jgi:hypothetical protein